MDKERILIIDDDENICKSLSDILRSKGYATECANSGKAGLEMARSGNFNLMLVDLKLPDADGIRLLKSIKAELPEIEALVMTAYASLESSVEALNSGAYGYIFKPFNIDSALISISRALERQRLSAENLRLLKEKTAAFDKLNMIDHMKDEFMRTVSHELKAPLAIVREAISQILALMHGNVTQDQTRMLNMSLNNIDRLVRLINNLLDISRIESGKVEIQKEAVDIVGLAQETINSFSIIADEKGLTIKKKFSSNKIMIEADKDKIAEVLTNLVSNAIKFTQKGHIEIDVDEKDRDVECSVADTGIGISKNDLNFAFTKFRQFNKSIPKELGTGLGMAISKGLVELHNGKISVESQPGVGTKVTFILPKK